MTDLFFAAAFLLPSPVLWAQSSSQKGWIESDYPSGCAPLSVELRHTGVRSGLLFVDFSGDPADRFSDTGFTQTFNSGETLSFEYTDPGTYLIRVVDQSGSGSPEDRFDFLEITVAEPIEPVFYVSNCTNHTVALTLDFDQDSYDSYRIDFGDGTTTTVTKNDPDVLTYTYASQGNYDIIVAGQLTDGLNSHCASSRQPVSTIQDLTPPAIRLLEVHDQNTALLSYDPLMPAVRYRLEIDEGSGFNELMPVDPAINRSSITVNDTGLDLISSTYLFRIVAFETCNNTEAYSEAISSVAFTYRVTYVPSAINIALNWRTSPDGLTQVYYIADGNAESLSDNTIGQKFISITDCLLAPEIYFEADFGGVISRSVAITPDLQGTLTPPALSGLNGAFSGRNLILRYEPPSVTAAFYTVYKKDASGIFRESGSSNTTTFTDTDLSGSAGDVCYM